MRSTHSFSTDFIIRECNADKTKAMIFARITVDGSSKEISIKEKIDYADWHNKREIVKGKNQVAQGINKAIDDILFRIKVKYRMLENACSLITAEIVNDAYLGIHTLQKGDKLIELTLGLQAFCSRGFRLIYELLFIFWVIAWWFGLKRVEIPLLRKGNICRFRPA